MDSGAWLIFWLLMFLAPLSFLMILKQEPDNHGVIPHGLDDLKKKVDTCQQCSYCRGYLQPSLRACVGCGAPNPCYVVVQSPLDLSKKESINVDSEFNQQLRKLRESVEQLGLVAPIIFGEEDCDVDALVGDNTVFALTQRCRRREGPLPSSPYSGFIDMGTVKMPERTSRYMPYGCREGQRCAKWDKHGYCVRCL